MTSDEIDKAYHDYIEDLKNKPPVKYSLDEDYFFPVYPAPSIKIKEVPKEQFTEEEFTEVCDELGLATESDQYPTRDLYF